MSIMDIFLPGYNNSNPDKRLSYLSQINDDSTILDVFIKTKYYDVKILCIERLHYEDGLIKILKDNINDAKIVKSVFKRFGPDNYRRNERLFMSSEMFLLEMSEQKLPLDICRKILSNPKANQEVKSKLAGNMSETDLKEVIEKDSSFFEKEIFEYLLSITKIPELLYVILNKYIERYQNDLLLCRLLNLLPKDKVVNILKKYRFIVANDCGEALYSIICAKLNPEEAIDVILHGQSDSIKNTAFKLVKLDQDKINLLSRASNLGAFWSLIDSIKESRMADELFKIFKSRYGNSWYSYNGSQKNGEKILNKIISLSDSEELYQKILTHGLFTEANVNCIINNSDSFKVLNHIVQKCDCNTETYIKALDKMNNVDICNYIIKNDFPLKLKKAAVRFADDAETLLKFIKLCPESKYCGRSSSYGYGRNDLREYCKVVFDILKYNTDSHAIAEAVISNCHELKLLEIAYHNIGEVEKAISASIEQSLHNNDIGSQQIKLVHQVSDQNLLKTLCLKAQGPLLIELIKKIDDVSFIASYLSDSKHYYQRNQDSTKQELVKVAFDRFSSLNQRRILFEGLVSDVSFSLTSFMDYISDPEIQKQLLAKRSHFLIDSIKKIKATHKNPDIRTLTSHCQEMVLIAERMPVVFKENWDSINKVVDMKVFHYTSHNDYTCGKRGWTHHEDQSSSTTANVNIIFPPYPAHKL